MYLVRTQKSGFIYGSQILQETYLPYINRKSSAAHPSCLVRVLYDISRGKSVDG